MSFELKSLRKIGPRLQKVFDDEVAEAIGHLEGLTKENALHGTHAARKHFKKIRALLRLAREGIGKSGYEMENACFRDAGRKLRDLRDAQVLLKALDTLRERFVDGKHPALITHARRLLAADERRCMKGIATAKAMADVVTALRAARTRGAAWNLKKFGWKETRRGLKRSYKRALNAGHRVFADPSVARLHEWRKRSKDLWYHAQLLRKACPEFMKEFAHELEVLTEFLGDDHDLAMLRGALVARREVLGRPQALAAYLKMIDLRRGELMDAAMEFGQRIYNESAAVFARKLDEKREEHRRFKKKAKKLSPKLRGGGSLD